MERNCYGSDLGPGGVTISAGCSVDDESGDETSVRIANRCVSLVPHVIGNEEHSGSGSLMQEHLLYNPLYIQDSHESLCAKPAASAKQHPPCMYA